jgi:hypothetical protein
MKHSDFKIGNEFLTATGRWRCTDVGVRTIVAIKLDLDHDPRWYNGRLTPWRNPYSMKTGSRIATRRRKSESSMIAARPVWS